MTPNTVSRPSQEILLVADLIEEGIGRLLRARAGVDPGFGTYESSVEARNLLNLTVRNLEAIVELARRDLVLVPAAAVLARSVFEISVRVIWLLYPSDPFERESRWLVHLRTEENAHIKWARLVEQLGGDAESSIRLSDQFRSFREGVSAKLPPGTPTLDKVPDLRAMLRSLGEERKYLYYMRLSQFTHGSHLATGLYRKHLGTMKELGEFVGPDDWRWVFVAAWFSFSAAARSFMEREAAGQPAFEDATFPSSVEDAIAKLGTP